MTIESRFLRSSLAGLAVVAMVGLGTAATAEDDDDATVSFKVLTLQTAVDLTQAAMTECRERGYQVAVSVVDRFGVEQVTMRDRFAGPHTPDTAYRKAWTSVSFRTDTLELSELTETGEAWAIRNVTHALPLGGGVQVLDGDGSMLGAVGVSGAPSGGEDEACARAGIAAIEDRIAF